MKTLLIIAIFLSVLIGTTYSQDVFGRQNGNRIQLLYIEKITSPDTLLSSDSVFHYSGTQGGTVVYNPYGMLAARLVSNVLAGKFRVEFGGGVNGQQEGWLPFFMKNSGGLMTVVQSNSAKCDCSGEAEKIFTQIDVQMYNVNPSIADPGNYLTMGCTFTIFIYWISDI
jgi:hypothetical protein